MEAWGLHQTLKRLAPKERHWLRGRLRPTEVQAEVDALLDALEQDLRAQAEDDGGASDQKA